MISTQPGSTPLSSFKIVSLEEEVPSLTASHGNDIGPYGDQDDELVFIQKLVPETDVLTVRLASRGTRVAEVRLGEVLDTLYSSMTTSVSLIRFAAWMGQL